MQVNGEKTGMLYVATSPLYSQLQQFNRTNTDVVIEYDVLTIANHYLHKVSVYLLKENVEVEDLYACFDINLPNFIRKTLRKRKLEFFTGRLAAKFALEELGLEDFTIRKGIHGEPLWPNGVRGSISHTGTKAFCTAIASVNQVTHKAPILGIDIEFNSKDKYFVNEPCMCHVFLSALEQSNVLKNKKKYIYLIIFSAKESFIKAMYSKYNQVMDFFSLEYQGIGDNFLEFKLRDFNQNRKKQCCDTSYLQDVIIKIYFCVTSNEVITIYPIKNSC